MIRVHLEFDPARIGQPMINVLKSALVDFVVHALSSEESLPEDQERAQVSASEIMVAQHAYHETDINVPMIDITVSFDDSLGRDADIVARLIAEAVSDSNILPPRLSSGIDEEVTVVSGDAVGYAVIPL